MRFFSVSGQCKWLVSHTPPVTASGVANVMTNLLTFIIFGVYFRYKKQRGENMDGSIITPYDIALAEMLVAYRQGAKPGNIAFVAGFDERDDGVHVYQGLNAYDFKSRKGIIVENWEWKTKGAATTYDIIEYEVREGKNLLTRNFTKEFKKNIGLDFDRAYGVVFGSNAKGNGK